MAEELDVFIEEIAPKCKELNCVLLNQSFGRICCDIAGSVIGQANLSLPYANKHNVSPNCPQSFYSQLK